MAHTDNTFRVSPELMSAKSKRYIESIQNKKAASQFNNCDVKEVASQFNNCDFEEAVLRKAKFLLFDKNLKRIYNFREAEWLIFAKYLKNITREDEKVIVLQEYGRVAKLLDNHGIFAPKLYNPEQIGEGTAWTKSSNNVWLFFCNFEVVNLLRKLYNANTDYKLM